MVRSKSTEGLSLPDFKKYHKAAVLLRIIEWVHGIPYYKGDIRNLGQPIQNIKNPLGYKLLPTREEK